MSTCGPSHTSKVNMRFCTPTCGAARPIPDASYIVSTIVSTKRASFPSMSVTSLALCFNTGSPKTLTGYVLIRLIRVREHLVFSWIPRPLTLGIGDKTSGGASLVAGAELAEHADEVHRGVRGGLARRV